MSNQYTIVENFEKSVADYIGCKYAIAVDSCTNAIFLCAKYLKVTDVVIPSKTYPSIPCSIIHAGGKLHFEDLEWKNQGFYRLSPYPIYDAAHLFKKDMYRLINQPLCGGDKEIYPHAFVCISFSMTKPINIGKGGMILTDDYESVAWFKQMRYCGRHEKPLMEDVFELIGWNMYMTPEQAARGLSLVNYKTHNEIVDTTNIPEYPNLSQFPIYKN